MFHPLWRLDRTIDEGLPAYDRPGAFYISEEPQCPLRGEIGSNIGELRIPDYVYTITLGRKDLPQVICRRAMGPLKDVW
jgi:hypothetical protein